ncbi:MAG: hypothetical protein DRI74_08025 [Bacteroidetes bacterium]|nr:MAG: hypothetical protein DRI74_08025 [Bacteroidota bacterium]
MKKLIAFLNLIRWKNLVVLILAQGFLHFMIIQKLVFAVGVELPLRYYQLGILILSTVLIAAAGNIFNDITDIKVDKINKPKEVIIGQFIKVKTAIFWAWMFNGIGFALALILSYQLQLIQLALIHVMVILLLKRYSESFKNKVLVGNLLIALFTGLSIFLVYLYNLVSIINDPIIFVGLQKQLPFIFNLSSAYVFFAFLSNLIREITKDAEDIEGDEIFGIQTFSVAYGTEKAVLLMRSLNAFLAISLSYFVYYSFKMNWIYLAVYLIVAVLIPVFYFEWTARKAKLKTDFMDLSFLSKIIMLAGILSMQVFSLQF